MRVSEMEQTTITRVEFTAEEITERLGVSGQLVLATVIRDYGLRLEFKPPFPSRTLGPEATR